MSGLRRAGSAAIAWIIAGALVISGLAACSADAPSAEAPAPAAAAPHAVAILEPPRLEIGGTAVVEVVVSVPTGSRVTALPVPEETPGLWVLEAQGPSVESHPGRDLHRTQFRVRARETGLFAWPGGEILTFRPDGQELRLTLEPRPFRVESVSEELPEQRTFFSYEAPSGRATSRDLRREWIAGLTGACLALAAVALIGFVRRSRAAETQAASVPLPDASPWRAAQAALAAAVEIAESDPVRAADMASAGLRLYVDRRFQASTSTATTEELRGAEIPFLLTTRWEALLDLLARLDALRFPRPAADPSAARDALRSVVEDAQRLVTDAPPRGGDLT